MTGWIIVILLLALLPLGAVTLHYIRRSAALTEELVDEAKDMKNKNQ